MAETHIFLIHSRLDTNLPNFFDKAAGKTNVILWEAEWFHKESHEDPDWLHLKNQIERSTAVFFLKGPNVAGSAYTSNWISWECGIAASMGKDLWVFESIHSPVFMPIPYLTDYVPYDEQDYQHGNFITGIMYNYAKKKPQSQGVPTECSKCTASYNMHTAVPNWNCPTCQRRRKWGKPTFSQQAVKEYGLIPVNEPLVFARDYPRVKRS
jgi:hypothetical protein